MICAVLGFLVWVRLAEGENGEKYSTFGNYALEWVKFWFLFAFDSARTFHFTTRAIRPQFLADTFKV
jgi:hypothetical protein